MSWRRSNSQRELMTEVLWVNGRLGESQSADIGSGYLMKRRSLVVMRRQDDVDGR